jgi:hypothetical protein
MISDPFIIALMLGLVVSAGLWFIFIWPSQEPPDDDEPHDSD